MTALRTTLPYRLPEEVFGPADSAAVGLIWNNRPPPRADTPLAPNGYHTTAGFSRDKTMTQSLIAIALHATEAVRLHTLVLPLGLHASAAQSEGPLRAEIIPPAGPDGCIEGADGRRQYVADMGALAAAIAAQAVQPRIDYDHVSERVSPTFNGSTAARGWVRHPRLNARGGIDADLHVDAATRERLGSEEYRYLSPALRLDGEERIIGLSSIALVNDPNLPLAPLRVHNQANAGAGATGTAPDPQVEEARRLMAEAATEAVDLAVEHGQILPRDREYHLSAITTHAGGVRAGIAAFRTHVAAGEGEAAPGADADARQALMARTGPRGVPPGRTGALAAPAFDAPPDVGPATPERLALHAQITDYARTHGVSYRDAVEQFGALGLDRR